MGEYLQFTKVRLLLKSFPESQPNAEESKRSWGDLWSIGKGHNRESEWLKGIKNELVSDKNRQERVVISFEKVTKQYRKMPKWKAPRKDGVQGYWIKNLSNFHDCLYCIFLSCHVRVSE